MNWFEEINKCKNDFLYFASENLPEELKPSFTTDNDHYKQFTNGNSIGFFTPTQMCSRSFNHLMIQEAAFIGNMEEHWKSLCVTDDCKVVSISSVNGQQGWFHKTYKDTVEGKNNFVLFDTHFREHPEYASEEFEEMIRSNLGKKGFVQEFLCHFLEVKSSI